MGGWERDRVLPPATSGSFSSLSQQRHGQRCLSEGLCSCSSKISHPVMSFPIASSPSDHLTLSYYLPGNSSSLQRRRHWSPLPPSLPSPGHLGSFDLFCKVHTQESFHFLFRSRHSHLNIALCRARMKVSRGELSKGRNASLAETESVRACGAREEQALVAKKKKYIKALSLYLLCNLLCFSMCLVS